MTGPRTRESLMRQVARASHQPVAAAMAVLRDGTAEVAAEDGVRAHAVVEPSARSTSRASPAPLAAQPALPVRPTDEQLAVALAHGVALLIAHLERRPGQWRANGPRPLRRMGISAVAVRDLVE